MVDVPRPNRRILTSLLGLLLGLLALAGAVGATPAGAQGGEEPVEVVRGLLNDTKDTRERDDDEPVEGVDITVRPVGGDEIDTVTTDEEGRWEVEVPEPGSYEVAIDVDTLPDDVALRNEDRDVLTVTVNLGQSKTVTFALGEDTRQTVGALDRILQKIVLGINFGLIIAMMAIGLSLIFGTTGLTNFAHAEMVTFGALVAWFLNLTVGLHLVPATVIAMVVGGAASGLFDLGVWRPLRRRKTGLIAMMVASIGLSLLIR